MPKQLPTSISRNTYPGLSELMHNMLNFGIDGNIISGGMLGNDTPDVYGESATQLATLGSKLRMNDGREFIYCEAGAAEIGLAHMAQAEAAASQWYDQVQTLYGWTAGEQANEVLITAGNTPAANEWAEGWMFVNKGTGLGYSYKILNNTSHATIPIVTIARTAGVVADIPAASEVTILKSNFKDTILVATGGLTAIPIGIPLITVTATYFYWSQVKGPAPFVVDTDESLTIGLPVAAPATCAVAGTCGPAVTLEGHYGTCMRVGIAAEIALVNLDLGL